MRSVVEIRILFWRALREIPRIPTRIVFPVLIPVMQLILFSAVFTNVAEKATAARWILSIWAAMSRLEPVRRCSSSRKLGSSRSET